MSKPSEIEQDPVLLEMIRTGLVDFKNDYIPAGGWRDRYTKDVGRLLEHVDRLDRDAALVTWLFQASPLHNQLCLYFEIKWGECIRKKLHAAMEKSYSASVEEGGRPVDMTEIADAALDSTAVLAKENERLREALQFYADVNNHYDRVSAEADDSIIVDDEGHRAREALHMEHPS